MAKYKVIENNLKSNIKKVYDRLYVGEKVRFSTKGVIEGVLSAEGVIEQFLDEMFIIKSKTGYRYTFLYRDVAIDPSLVEEI